MDPAPSTHPALSLLENLPPRSAKPRVAGLTMVMDKGLSLMEAEAFLENAAPFTDLIKFGWSTGLFNRRLKDKIQLYQEAGIRCYMGGTLFEIYAVRQQIPAFKRLVEDLNLETVEISDGSLDMPHDRKCEYIADFSKDFNVLSEVGSKDAEKIIAPYRWIAMMKAELSAGSELVIAEAREAGNVGIFRSTGEVRSGLVEEILTQIPSEKILWEAPNKAQQTWFIRMQGADVSLGNIAPSEVIPLETLRLGLRSDTFGQFLGS
jgi:phosphosulfolactate synthase